MLPVIDFQHVSKRYRVRGLARREASPRMSGGSLWALRDVTFSVDPGQALGIVGFNGAGKTTVLKLIAGITSPTEGHVTRRGQIAALIELGSGFHPDLSGRDNLYLSAAILGVTRRDVRTRFDSIVEFAGLSSFIDAPVKQYSAGMQARLAFSVAVHAHPDILLVDEVLSVGDAPFQVRCMERIHQMRQEGLTLVFVSHYLGLVADACERAIHLDQGEARFIGQAQDAVTRYQDTIARSGLARAGATPSGIGARSGSFDVQITSVSLLDGQRQARRVWETGESMIVLITYAAHRPVAEPLFGVEITRSDGLDCFATNTGWDGISTGHVQSSGAVELHIPRLDLAAGSYTVGVGILERTGVAFFDFHDRAYPFEVHADRRHRGVVLMEHNWVIERPVLPG